MRAPALAQAATELPWLSPCAASLLALAGSRTPLSPGREAGPDLRTAAGVWSAVRRDPGCVLLLVRSSLVPQAASCLSFFPALVHNPAVLDTALRALDPPLLGFADWGHPELQPIYQACLSYAQLAQSLAVLTGKCDPENAWAAGLLAPLGWLAAAAVAPAQTAACLADPEMAGQPALVQQRFWGLEQAAIARRLCRRWQLPRWLAVVPSYLGLSLATADPLGADRNLFLVVQLAVILVQERGGGLHLPVGATAGEAFETLSLPADEQEAVSREADAVVRARAAAEPLTWETPERVPLLRDLLRLAAENQRLAGAPELERLERDVDCLHQAVRTQTASEAQRLQGQKLSAVAEFAAGAGHEINNPLAVISGQAQYLLGHETEPARQKALQTIIGQTRRIHQVLSELMQFARPPRPRKQSVDLAALVREVVVSLQDLAAQRCVRLLYTDFAAPGPGEATPVAPLFVKADPQHVSIALACLLRNAIEAAPPEGWAQVRLETPASQCVELLIEDNGAGPTLAQCEHLFDPFYSGRPAGRGKGLGLARAWRLAREQGGDVRFDRLPDGPTRFLLSLPRLHPDSLPITPSSPPEFREPEPVASANGVGH